MDAKASGTAPSSTSGSRMIAAVVSVDEGVDGATEEEASGRGEREQCRGDGHGKVGKVGVSDLVLDRAVLDLAEAEELGFKDPLGGGVFVGDTGCAVSKAMKCRDRLPLRMKHLLMGFVGLCWRGH